MAPEADILNSEPQQVVGRLAPSPTGALHLGNARSFLLAWLSARQQSGKLILRIEDIDSPRVKPWAIESTIEDLSWLGLDWDVGPDTGAQEDAPEGKCGQVDPPIAFLQSQRLDRFKQVLQELIEQRAVYPCICTRSDVSTAASAPHIDSQGLEGTVYPGTCRGRPIDEIGSYARFAWRFHFADELATWFDKLHGRVEANPARQLGDFVAAKGDGTPAYQLAVVVDDHDMGVTEVIRGDDLIYSTFRQLAIIKLLGWTPPNYVHVPLIVGADGRRLAKRHGDTRISCLRKAGISAEAIAGYLASSVGLLSRAERCRPHDLIGRLDWQRLATVPTVFELEAGLSELRSL